MRSREYNPKRLLLIAVLLLMVFTAAAAFAQITVQADMYPVSKTGWYSTKEEVAVYLATYERLPGNYITKKEAQERGWNASSGNLWKVADGYSIGGDRYGNYEGNLPDARGRKWTECDIDFGGGRRGGKRIVFSNDGLIFYTGDHYNTFDEIVVVFSTQTASAKPAKTPRPETAKSVYTDRQPVYGECYTDWEDVAAYLLQFQKLPVNYISMDDAKSLGFSSKKDNMGDVAPEFTIGGGVFANREKLLPEASGRTWFECDVDTVNGKRGKHRLVYSSDGLVYLTRDKYKSFVRVEEK